MMIVIIVHLFAKHFISIPFELFLSILKTITLNSNFYPHFTGSVSKDELN